jgi:putative transposase
MSKGFMYLVAILDLYSRKVLSWRISNTMTVDFCISALREAILVYGIPEIFNTDQGSQFTADEFTSELVDHGITISMDGKGRAIDNVFVERLWRTVKYEHIYINPAEDGLELREGLESYFEWYNTTRPHSSLDNMTPDEIYYFTHETDGLQVA